MRRRTRACSPNFIWFWKPTRLKLSARRFSWRSCTTAQGRRPVRGLSRPMGFMRSEEHTSELQSLRHLVCRLLLEKKIQTYDDLYISPGADQTSYAEHTPESS